MRKLMSAGLAGSVALTVGSCASQADKDVRDLRCRQHPLVHRRAGYRSTFCGQDNTVGTASGSP
jgi:hypothetical protein